MNKIRILAAVLLPFFMGACSSSGPSADANSSVEAKKIWDAAPHNAFTDLIRFDGNFYCTFREGPSHVSGPNGKARVLRSADGDTWESVAAFEIENHDVRDPKISITPDNRLMILMDAESYQYGKVATRKPYVSYLDKTGGTFTEPAPSVVDSSIAVTSDWVWRVSWYNGAGYAIDYQPHAIYLLKTTDGTRFENVCKIDVDGSPNESTIRFDKNGKMYVLIRREQNDKSGMLAVSDPPYQQWNFHKLDRRLGGPNFIFLNDTTLCIGSRYFPQEASSGPDMYKKPKTAIMLSDLTGKIFKTIELPSGGDNSYPGLLVYEDHLWVSYYSSHEGKTSIYLAKIPVDQLK
jgi:hypothetical protein